MERRNRIMLLHKDRRLCRVGVARTRTGSKCRYSYVKQRLTSVISSVGVIYYVNPNLSTLLRRSVARWDSFFYIFFRFQIFLFSLSLLHILLVKLNDNLKLNLLLVEH